MGEYFTDCKMKFKGTTSEISMLKHLLNLMNKEDDIEDFSEEFGTIEKGEKVIYEFSFDSEYVILQNALFGEIEDRGEEKYFTRYWPSFNLELAPSMFAALFPGTEFDYELSWEYGNSGESEYIFAVYDGSNLKCANFYSNIWDDILDIYKRIKCLDADQKEWNEKVQYGYNKIWNEMKDDYDAICDQFGLGDFKGRNEKSLESLYIAMNGGYKKVRAIRNEKYESSFFNEGDLQAYLVHEQIKNHDMTLADYIKTFSFTEGLFKEFIDVSAECNFPEMTSFLLEEKQNRVIADEKGCDGTSILKPGKQECSNGKNDEIDGQSGFEFKDKIFVLTGFGELTFELAPFIEARGGIVKSSTVLKTDYLIFDEKDGINTVKYRRAIELNAKGKNIQMIPGKKFFEMVDFK